LHNQPSLNYSSAENLDKLSNVGIEASALSAVAFSCNFLFEFIIVFLAQ